MKTNTKEALCLTVLTVLVPFSAFANAESTNIGSYAMARLVFLGVLFVAVRYACKKVGINFPACILPKKQGKDKDGKDVLLGREGFFDFMRYSLYYFFKYTGKALYIAVVLPILFALKKTPHHRPQGFMSFTKRLWLINSFHKGLVLNGGLDRISQKASFTHSIVVAKTGGGKTSSFIIPNILIADNCSILTTDLSGDLYEKTSGYMAQRGYDVKIINPTKLDISNRYNPLASISTYKEILDVASILINAGDPNPKDPFWDNGAKTLLFIVITCLVNQKRKEGTSEFCNLPNVRFLLNNF